MRLCCWQKQSEVVQLDVLKPQADVPRDKCSPNHLETKKDFQAKTYGDSSIVSGNWEHKHFPMHPSGGWENGI